MTVEPGSVEHLAQVISHVVAPAFLVTAVGSVISILHDRLLSVAGRLGSLKSQGLAQASGDQAKLMTMARLNRRATLINLALLFAMIAGIMALLLIIGTFLAALLNVHHVWVAAALFMLSAIFLLCALVTFAIDVRMGLKGQDLH